MTASDNCQSTDLHLRPKLTINIILLKSNRRNFKNTILQGRFLTYQE